MPIPNPVRQIEGMPAPPQLPDYGEGYVCPVCVKPKQMTGSGLYGYDPNGYIAVYCKPCVNLVAKGSKTFVYCISCHQVRPTTLEHCPHCERKCPECQTWHSRGNTTQFDGKTMCFTCVNKLAKECQFCGRYVRVELLTGVEMGDPAEGVATRSYNTCETCLRQRFKFCQTHGKFVEPSHAQTMNILGYNWKPDPVLFFPKTVPDDMYFGVELEMEVCGSRDGVSAKIKELVGKKAYIKYDSSIWHGIELVTHPLGYGQLKEFWTKELFTALLDLGCHGDTDTTGLHVHLSKKAFHDEQLFNFMYFQFQNTDLIDAAAGRKTGEVRSGRDNHLQCAFPQVKFDHIRSWAAGESSPGDRHMAINLIPATTVEVRYYKSTLDWTVFHARMQFLHAIWKYTARRSSFGRLRSNRSVFKRFVHMHSADYPELIGLLPQWLGECADAPRTAIHSLPPRQQGVDEGVVAAGLRALRGDLRLPPVRRVVGGNAPQVFIPEPDPFERDEPVDWEIIRQGDVEPQPIPAAPAPPRW